VVVKELESGRIPGSLEAPLCGLVQCKANLILPVFVNCSIW
jgi:hypothetical protein